MKFVFSIFFMSGLFLVAPSSEAQKTSFGKGDHCLRWAEGKRSCKLYTKTCRAPRAGENRVSSCSCSWLWEDAISHYQDYEELSLAMKLALWTRGDRSMDHNKHNISFGFGENDNEAKEDALNTCGAMLFDTFIPMIKKYGVPEPNDTIRSYASPGYYDHQRIATADRLIEALSNLTPNQVIGSISRSKSRSNTSHTRSTYISELCTETFVCDRGLSDFFEGRGGGVIRDRGR